MLLLLALTACSAPADPILGEWVAAFYRSQALTGDTGDTKDIGYTGDIGDTGATIDCQDDSGAESFRGWLQIVAADPVAGTHLVLASAEGEAVGRPVADNGLSPSSGMSGPLRGGWEDEAIRIHLLPDLESLVADEADRQRWSQGHLVLESHGWSRSCQVLQWQWVDLDGQPDPEQSGQAFLRRG